MEGTSKKEGDRESILKLNGVSMSYGTHLILENVSFDVYRNEILGVIGASGSGKTTLLKVLVGFLNPDKGEVLFRKKEEEEARGNYHIVHENKELVTKRFGFAAQEPSFYERLTVVENLSYFGHLYHMNDTAVSNNIKSLVHLLGLRGAENTLAGNLSGGMQKRLDIACALIHDPDILILDEPTADLDPLLRRQILVLLEKINKLGTTIILSSHFLADVEELCSRIAILHNTHILEIGTAMQIKSKYSTNEEIVIQTSPGRYAAILKRLGKKSIEKTALRENRCVIYTPKAVSVLKRLLHVVESSKEQLIEVEVNKPSLTEIFEVLAKAKDVQQMRESLTAREQRETLEDDRKIQHKMKRP